jgi:hypothetical protein
MLLSMKITGFVLLLLCMQVSAAGFAQQRITIKIKESSVKELLKAVERQTDYRFVYSNTAMSGQRNALDIREASLEEAMRLILKDSRLTYALKENNLVVVYPAAVTTDRKDVVVTGKVLDDAGLPLPGVSVKVTGLAIATITDANGAYSIRVPDGNASLEFSFIGYAKQVVNVAGRTLLNIELKSDSQNLQEVTVTGYTSYNRQQSASSSAVVSGKDMAQTSLSTFDQVLQGRVSGLQVSSGSGQPGASSRVILRGIGTISGNTAPLYVLDGEVKFYLDH